MWWQYWRDHVLAAAAHEDSIVEYSATNNLKTKDLCQWKTVLTKRGYLESIARLLTELHT